MSSFEEYPSTIRQKFAKFIRSCDMFGTPVTLNYKGSSTVKTVVGGGVSFIVYIVFF